MYDAMLSMHKWSRVGLVIVPMFRRLPAHVASFLNDDAPPAILVVVSECEASSAVGLGAVVPDAKTSKLLVSHFSVLEHQAVLRRFVDANAFVGQGSLGHEESGLHIDAVEALRVAGYVHATFDEFGGLQLVMNPSSLDWKATVGLHSPMSATR